MAAEGFFRLDLPLDRRHGIHVVEGRGTAHIGDKRFAFEPHDVFVVPPWTPYYLTAD